MSEQRRRHRARAPSPRITYTITQEMIDYGKQRNSRNCPNSEALKVAYPKFSTVTSDIQTIRGFDPEKNLTYTWLTPRLAADFIVGFDEGRDVRPFTCTLKSAVRITRPRKHTKPEPTQEEKKTARTQRAVLRKETVAKHDEPFKPSPEYTTKVRKAMDDPKADLGPPVVLDISVPGATPPPVLVGGRLPRRPTNIRTTRRFGLRELVP